MAAPLRAFVEAIEEQRKVYEERANVLETKTRCLRYIAQQMRRLHSANERAAAKTTRSIEAEVLHERKKQEDVLEQEVQSLRLVEDALSRAEVVRFGLVGVWKLWWLKSHIHTHKR